MPAKRADWSGWRRRAKSEDRWELVVTQKDCTAGAIWEALQREVWLRVRMEEDGSPTHDWEYAVTLAGQTPDEVPPRSASPRTSTYMDRMLRARPR